MLLVVFIDAVGYVNHSGFPLYPVELMLHQQNLALPQLSLLVQAGQLT